MRFTKLILLILMLLSFNKLSAQTSESQQLHDLLTSPNCQRACFLGIQPGLTTQAEVRSLLASMNIQYRVYSGQASNNEANGTYYWVPNSSTPFMFGGEVSVRFTNNIATQILIPMSVLVSTILDTYGNPVGMGSGDGNYYLEYPPQGLVFRVVPVIDSIRANGAILTDDPVVNGRFTASYGDTSVNQSCTSYGTPPCIAPTAVPATPTRTPTPGGPTATRTPTPTPTRTPTPGGRAVSSLTLVNADTDADIINLSDGYVLDLSVYPRVNVRANVSGQVESVRFGFDGNANYRTENGPPYAPGPNNGGLYDPWVLSLGTHTLSATPYSADNASGTAGAALTVQFSVVTGGSATATPTPVPATVLYRIDAGGSGGTFSGVSWAADAYFTGGVVSNLPNPIANTTDDGLYTTERSTSADTLGFSYALPVTNGTYTVRLHFAETYWVGGANRGIPGVNKRVFNVQLEGTTVLTNYDITAQVGALAADIRTFTVMVTDGTLNINFPAASVNRPTLAALEVIGQ